MQQAFVATGTVAALSAGCSGKGKKETAAASSSAAAAAPAAAVSSAVRLVRRRSMHWTVEMATDPDTANDTFIADGSLQVTTTWRQEAGPERLSASGDVLVQGAPGATKATVKAIPLCAPAEHCAPVEVEVRPAAPAWC